MPTPMEAVADASKAFTAAESSLQKAIDKVAGLPKHFAFVHAGGPLELPEGVPQFGYLEMSEYNARARVVAGMLAEAQLALVSLHRDAYARAQELGIDGDVSTMGGGGR